MKIYFQIVAVIIQVVLLIGFVLPYLFSAKNNLAVILGAVIVVVMVPFLFKQIKSIYLNFSPKKTNNNEDK